ncbi:MAG: efflux RND transporter periplasmic adaptor subunit [Phycisphaerae bacterium]|nr:efflux RND transporter periplasmic adaptor subunit [Phycisphaerae bacterium]MDD5381538.1 efflux RND transporter periplasmic adaptor subunit [Phycisphaerae bacterium]
MENNSGSVTEKRRFLQPKILALAGAVVILLIVVAVVAFNHSGSKTILAGDMPTFAVKQGPLRISATESGTIQAREQIILKCEVEGKTTILTLVEEGTRVKKGDLLVELDSSALLDERVDHEIRVQNTEAAFVGARENLAVAENQAKSDIDKAALAFDFAKQDLRKYVEGEYLNQRKEMESEITLAKEELQTAEEKLKWSQKLKEKEYISQTELQIDELSAHKGELNLELAENNLRLLEDFTHPRNLAKLESDVNQAEMALERTSRKAKADVVQAEADLKAKESEFQRQKDKLKKNEEQIAKTKIYAPADGLVIYATSAKTQGWRGNQEPLIEGREVREQEELIYLPTATAVKAVVKVHETSLQKVKPGLPVVVTVDALPGKTFTGRVEKIAPLPDGQMIWMNPDLKVYNTEVYLDGEGDYLRTGMSCKAEIIIEEYDDVMYIPVQAVLRVGGEPTVYVQKGGEFEPRKIKIGLDNNRMMRILEGLKEGEVVLLTPPLAPSTVEQGGDRAGETPAAEVGTEQRARTTGGEGVKEAGIEKVEQKSPKLEGEPSPEQRQKMREKFENMSDEEKENMRKQREGRRQKQSGEGE